MKCGNCKHETEHNIKVGTDIFGSVCEESGCFCDHFKTISNEHHSANENYHNGVLTEKKEAA